ncbi:MAG: hypothetical protein EB060_08620 [Proteobacteria bacterium]|nr:hypothetical protein [Pseudomonadota bacterium]
MISPISSINPYQAYQKAQKEQRESASTSFWGNGDLPSLGDIIDTINPLQHIPVVSDIYRQITGDDASTGSKIAGGALYGGIAGLLASFLDITAEQTNGKDSTNTLLGLLNDTHQERPIGSEILTASAEANGKVDYSQPQPSARSVDTASYINRYEQMQQLASPLNTLYSARQDVLA